MPTAPEYLFNTLLAASASRIGTAARVIINPEGGYKQPCIIWTANVSHSGQAKTPPQQEIINPLEAMEAEASVLYDAQVENYGMVQNQAIIGLLTQQPELRLRVGVYCNYLEIPADWVFELPQTIVNAT